MTEKEILYALTCVTGRLMTRAYPAARTKERRGWEEECEVDPARREELSMVAESLTLAREDSLPRDSLGRAAEAHWPWDSALPWVDLAANHLRAEACQGQVQATGRSLCVIVSHDIDHTTSVEPSILVNSLLHAVGLRSHGAIPLMQALRPHFLLRILERVLEFEREQGVRSILFMLAGPYGLGRYSSRTSCRWKSAGAVIRLAGQAGMEIGLHGSFAAREQDSYGTERKRLEDQVGQAVEHHRNHYLRFDGLRVCDQLERAGLRWDHSIGFASRAGFRSGTARPYYGYNRVQQRPSSVGIVPMAFMDTAVAGKGVKAALAVVGEVLRQAREVRGCVSLNFHPEFLAASNLGYEVFRESVLLAKELGADLETWAAHGGLGRLTPGSPGGLGGAGVESSGGTQCTSGC